MKITFKNVGQGDSIILEWIEGTTKKVGIIDCNLNSRKENHVLEHIKKEKYKEIYFIILSHPHSDHFSGLPELLSYLLENKICLRYFIHTCTSVPDNLIMANESKEATTNLQKVFRLVQNLRDELNTLEGTIAVGITDEFPVGIGYSLKLLAPTSKHIQNYTGKIEYDHDYEVEGNSHYANWLSTVFQLKNQNSYVLFTSDAPRDVIKEIGLRPGNEYYTGENLVLGQIPHHGAGKNHLNSFWKLRNSKKNMPIVISVGKNNYGHPSKEAIDFFSKNNFAIYSTNEIGYLIKFSQNKSLSKKITHLDIFSVESTQNETSKFSGDKVFIFENGNIKNV